ncbi:immunity protein TriTu family protein [Brevibacillus parabrevis]|uniref:immunity protein TriTu family protein n=1 Tax=Brevibacillus parabrevis TaxID=54914 RepID=UPI003CD0C5D9
MLDNKFLLWIAEKKGDFQRLGFEVEIDKSRGEQEQFIDHAQRIYLENDYYASTICVWRSGMMEALIVDANTVETVIHDYKDGLDEEVDFNKIVPPYIHYMLKN